MAERIAWDKYEAAILLEAVLRVDANTESKNDAIERVSKQLRSMAKNRGLSIDDVYRNTNGMMIGAAGVGKTAYWLYPNIEYACASGMSFLSTDILRQISFPPWR